MSDFQLGSVLAITANDPDLVQASLFNILAALEFSDAVSASDKIAGAELNFWFCEQFNIGRDSAQAELLLSQFYIEASNYDGARAAIKRAARLMAGERNATDVAFFLYTMANLRTEQALHTEAPVPTNMIRAKLIRAGKIYTRLGNVIGERKIIRLMKRIDEIG